MFKKYLEAVAKDYAQNHPNEIDHCEKWELLEYRVHLTKCNEYDVVTYSMRLANEYHDIMKLAHTERTNDADGDESITTLISYKLSV